MAKKAKEPLKLDLACGQSPHEGFVGVDYVKLPTVKIVHDLEKFPWPFKTNSVAEVVCSHYIEHTKCLIKFMNELYRILEPNGKATLMAPYYSSVRATQDPTHRNFISEMSFLYYNKQWRLDNKLDHYPITCDFDFTYGYSLSPEWSNRSEEARNFAIMHYINVIADIHVTVTKRA